MTAASHVALIRGINVGGRNPVPMARLRERLGARGLDGVRTYIQSGNVLLSAPGRTEAQVAAEVEDCLDRDFDVATVVVAVTSATLRDAVVRAPAGFGDEPETFHCDVAFLRPGLDPADVLAAFGIREGVDAAWPGEGVVYFRRLSAERSRSRMSAVTSSRQYQDMTIRNWRTTTTLAGMLEA